MDSPVLLGAVAFLRSVNPDAVVSELPPDTAISEQVPIAFLVATVCVTIGDRFTKNTQQVPNKYQQS